MPERARTLDDYTDHELLDVAETAEVLKCSRDTVYDMARRGELPKPVKRGRKIAFSAFALRRWIVEQSDAEVIAL
jgi:excisionase family DNA binding protein